MILTTGFQNELSNIPLAAMIRRTWQIFLLSFKLFKKMELLTGGFAVMHRLGSKKERHLVACKSFGRCCPPGESGAKEKQIGITLLSLLPPATNQHSTWFYRTEWWFPFHASPSLVRTGIKLCLYKPVLAISSFAVATAICLKWRLWGPGYTSFQMASHRRLWKSGLWCIL